MKAILSFLLCVVVLHAECYAQNNEIAANGGPNYGTAGSLQGTYDGVLIATSEIDSSQTETFNDVTGRVQTSVQAPTSVTPNSVGIFDLGIEGTGISVGLFLMFAAGQAFRGNVVGVVPDPQAGIFDGVLGASFTPVTGSAISFTGTGANVTPFGGTPAATASGLISATIGNSSVGLSTTETSLVGTASLSVIGNITPPGDRFDVFGDILGGTGQSETLVSDEFQYIVEGVQQSGAVDIGTLPNLFGSDG